MRLPQWITAAIGRRWFRRLVRNPIPDFVSEVSADTFPIPLLCGGRDLVVRFRFAPPFERNVQFWGWKEWKSRIFQRMLAHGLAQMADIDTGRLYARESADGRLVAWMAFDKMESKACVGIFGRRTIKSLNDTFKSVLGDRAA
jgi:hypothetical protein